MVRTRRALYGTVQGVGFRYFTLRQARRADLCGCVWNRPDGAVELEAEGSAEGVAELLEAVGEGPRGARVERVEELAVSAADLPCPFEITGGAPDA